MHGAPIGDLAAVAASHTRLLATVAGFDDLAVAQPSGLPGWNRAQLITHLARNADSFRHVVEARLAGTLVDQYPGGAPARAAAIDAGRGRPASDLQADLARSVEWLHETFDAVPGDAWGLLTRLGPGLECSVASLVERRWREVEVHHTDLESGYAPSDWPAAFAARFLPPAVEALDERRAEAADIDDATWIVWADDLEMAWVVETSGGSAIVSPLDEALPDVMVRGSASGLLAWLLGRRTPEQAGLRLTGEDRLARLLPGWFPFA